jgi:hypothetical protein
MNDADQRPSAFPRAGAAAASGGLPYLIEIWNLPRTQVERVMARADTLTVARALFKTAVSENPSRRIVLRQGKRTIEDHG